VGWTRVINSSKSGGWGGVYGYHKNHKITITKGRVCEYKTKKTYTSIKKTYACVNGYVKSGGVCKKDELTYYSLKYKCENGFVLNNTKCIKKIKEYKDMNEKCPNGFKLENKECKKI
jgi:hypothetical protein